MRSPILLAAALSTSAAICLPSLATAQPASSAALQPLPEAAAPAPAPGRELSPHLALGLSIGVTAAGLGLFAGGAELEGDGGNVLMGAGLATMGLGPTAGHWYQGRLVTRGLGVRVAGAAAVLYAATQTELFCIDEPSCKESDLGGFLFLGGLAAIAIGTADDIITAPLEARRHNQERRRFNLSIAPRITDKDAGLVVGGTF